MDNAQSFLQQFGRLAATGNLVEFSATVATTFALIAAAEIGDKTQLAVVALSSTHVPAAVWLGATAALATTSAVGILAGRTSLKTIPLVVLHRISGAFFLVPATVAACRAYRAFTSGSASRRATTSRSRPLAACRT